MMQKDKISQLNELIELFEFNITQYKGKSYDEAKVRADFIDKFFHLLDWDVYNEQGYSEKYREVVREDRVTIKGKVKAPDYSFRIGGQRKFFVEAKKPAVDIKTEIDPAFQLRRYAYTAKLDLSILTDFEEFAVYDSRLKPNKTDAASTARIFYCNYKEYTHHLQFFYDTFSRPAILKGKFDEYVKTSALKKGTSPVDKEFLKLIETWRDSLAKNLALRNKELSIYELNYAVQVIIDRIIFLRIAEDRQMEDYGRIRELTENKKTIYPELVKLFLQADVKYNSGLFDFRKDQLTPHIKIDDKIIKDMIDHLYYPDSPYEFSVFDVEILGNIYEQFLGKTIRLTPAHQAKVEDKPDVKKAGGVYYTPKYIVDYIVEHTVGEKIKDKTPGEISKIKILDPACGSGSFLLGAYQLLMDSHLNYYTGGLIRKSDKISNRQQAILNKALKENKIYQTGEEEYHLTIEEKHDILLNNIFGVDIDRQAVEVTKLSLLLKLLEGESRESSGLLFKYSDIKLLPDLSDNIKCGNSLIGSDFYEKGQMSLFQDEETLRRINVFDWEKEFPGIFQNGGFDVVIGNPPYGAHFSQEVRHYLSKEYSISVPITDSFIIFLLKAFTIIKKNGYQSFIIPSSWLYMTSFLNIREKILSNYHLKEVLLFRGFVFQKVTVETCIEIIVNISSLNYPINYTEIIGDPKSFEGLTKVINKNDILAKKDIVLYHGKSESSSNLFNLILNKYESLGNLTTIICGLTPYRKGYGIPPQTKEIVNKRIFDSDHKVDDNYRQYIMGRDFNRYVWQIEKSRWIKYGDCLAEPRYSAPFDDQQKIVIRQTADSIIANLDTNKYLSLKNVHNLRIKFSELTYEYLLAVLNSKLISWWYQNLIPEKNRVFAEVKVVNLKKIPIKTIDFSNSYEKSHHERIVRFVNQMLELQKKYHSAKIETEKTLFKKQIETLDKQIDQLGYELYGLTDDEIKIVENELAGNR